MKLRFLNTIVKKSISGILLMTLFLFLAGSFETLDASDKRMKTGMENIRVILFDQHQTRTLLFFGYNGSITLKSRDFESTIHQGDTGARISLQNGNIVYERNGIRHASKEWVVSAQDTSFIRLLHEQAGWRYYKGEMRLTVENNRKIRVINRVGLEDYVASVVGSEMNFDNHEALKVQAVIARTYALWNISLFHESEYELNDHVLNQVYKGELVFKPQYRKAAEATRGEVLMWSNKLIMAVYHSTCGGRTTSNENVWIGNPLPYLIGVEDNGSCSASPHREWEYSIQRNTLYNLIKPDHFGNVQRIDIKQRDSFERVTLLTLVGRNKTHDITVNNLRLIINRHSGPLSIRSSYFSMEISGDSYIFKGKGLGHGVGLCQWGALGLAESGWNYHDILRFYYNGVDILDYSQLKGDGFKLARF